MKALTLSLLVLLLVTCKRENRPKEEQHYGPLYLNEFANYFWFKPGTYWIYENNRTGELDTCTLSYIKRDTITFFYEHSQFKRWYTYENLDFIIDTKHKTFPLDYSTAIGCLRCPNMDTVRSIRRQRYNIFYIPWNFYPDNSYYYSQLTIGNETFYNVYRFDQLDDSSLPNWDQTILPWSSTNGYAKYSSYYWAKNVGLVKITYKTNISSGIDSAAWILKEKNIIKQ